MRLYDEIIAEEKCKAEGKPTGEDLLCSIYEDRKLREADDEDYSKEEE